MQIDEWFNAARAGDDKRVAELLAEQPDLIKAKDQTRNTALHLAAEAGHEAVVALLLAARPFLLQARDIFGFTALDLAAGNGHEQVLPPMLATGLIGLDISGGLFRAAASGHDNMVELLLNARSLNFTLSEKLAVRALHCLVERGNQKAFTQLLALFPDLIDEVDVFGATALHHAARHGRDNLVSQILTLRPQMIDAECYDHGNALMSAVKGGHSIIAEKLLAIKPELISHVLENDGKTVLHYAVEGSNALEFVAKLWRMNPQALTHANVYFETPFHLAVRLMKNELIELFQWSLSFDDITRAFTRHTRVAYQERYRPVMEGLCESLFVSLNQDVVGTVLEYVGIDPAKRANKRTRLS